ncbi:carboxymuconolactone decarboxylase family protein [Tritonibacter horizontis]|uniref:Carboxymuconolactone decarboxylase family protein n=1 Tax=Tritonibacter horizontis TaxID=1768241 RepID=A0A132C3B2_9RHOB|nr:peroxidase-related enzyme [Tritonibacter horizontis]KUP95093.1 carboxymuconolactone decarboxylase family protein [Tritonibacter horizontis]
MAWIETIGFDRATGKLRKLYERLAGPNGEVDNIMQLHSLRPHSMEGHMTLYKNVLHHTANAHPKWFLEVLGIWVSVLNGCDYCIDHHFAGLKRQMKDDERSEAILAALRARDIEGTPVRGQEKAAMRYAQKLTEQPSAMTVEDVRPLRDVGMSDGEILEINQVVAYFAYANRTVLGLGCSTESEVLGLSPGNSADPSDWGHG